MIIVKSVNNIFAKVLMKLCKKKKKLHFHKI